MYTHVRAQVDNQGLSLLFNFSLVRETGAWQRASLGGAPRSVCPDPQASRCSAHHAKHTAPLQVEGLGLSFALVALDATTGAHAAPPPHTHTHTLLAMVLWWGPEQFQSLQMFSILRVQALGSNALSIVRLRHGRLGLWIARHGPPEAPPLGL